jgi:hypothetical protein
MQLDRLRRRNFIALLGRRSGDVRRGACTAGNDAHSRVPARHHTQRDAARRRPLGMRVASRSAISSAGILPETSHEPSGCCTASGETGGRRSDHVTHPSPGIGMPNVCRIKRTLSESTATVLAIATKLVSRLLANSPMMSLRRVNIIRVIIGSGKAMLSIT